MNMRLQRVRGLENLYHQGPIVKNYQHWWSRFHFESKNNKNNLIFCFHIIVKLLKNVQNFFHFFNKKWASLWESWLFAYAKTNTEISCAKTAQQISAFAFAIRIVQPLFYLNIKFQASSHLLWLSSPVCVGPGPKPQRPVFSQRGSYNSIYCYVVNINITI